MTDVDRDMLDGDGYPTDEALQTLIDYEGRPRGFIELVHSMWTHGSAEPERMTDEFGREVYRWRLITGGWSGNETTIGVIQERTMFWFRFWRMSLRGGLYEFDIPVELYNRKGAIVHWNFPSEADRVRAEILAGIEELLLRIDVPRDGFAADLRAIAGDPSALERVVDNAKRGAVFELVGELRRKARVEFDKHGVDDPRGAAIWDVAAWLQAMKG